MLTSDQIGGIVRALLTTVSGLIVAKGWTDANTAAWVSGGVLALATAGWSWWTNRPQKIVATPGVASKG